MTNLTKLVIGQASLVEGATNNSFKFLHFPQSKIKRAIAATRKARAKGEVLWDKIKPRLKLEMLLGTPEGPKETIYSNRFFQQPPQMESPSKIVLQTSKVRLEHFRF